jgi:hypothetical protein
MRTLAAALLFVTVSAAAAAQERDAAYWQKWLLESDWKIDEGGFSTGLHFLAQKKESGALLKVLGRYGKIVKEVRDAEEVSPDFLLASGRHADILVAMRHLCSPELVAKCPELPAMYGKLLNAVASADTSRSCLYALRNMGAAAKSALPHVRAWLGKQDHAPEIEDAKDTIKKIEGK